jgi:hypothetical protein
LRERAKEKSIKVACTLPAEEGTYISKTEELIDPGE